jgi:hypothetical protein
VPAYHAGGTSNALPLPARRLPRSVPAHVSPSAPGAPASANRFPLRRTRGNIELATELAQCLLARHNPLDCCPLELRAEDTPAVNFRRCSPMGSPAASYVSE